MSGVSGSDRCSACTDSMEDGDGSEEGSRGTSSEATGGARTQGNEEDLPKHIRVVQDEIATVEDAAPVRAELLRHYLVNLILLENLPEDERESSPIADQLARLSVLLEKLALLKKKLEKPAHRPVTREMERGLRVDKRSRKSSAVPRMKYQRNAERQRERVAVKEDFNIDSGNGKEKRLRKNR